MVSGGRVVLVLLGVLGIAGCSFAAGTSPEPRVMQVGMVARDVVSATIRDGEVRLGMPGPYRPQPGDQILEPDFPQRWLMRGGKAVGAIAGKGKDTFIAFDQVSPGRLTPAALQTPKGFRLTSTGDPVYKVGAAPTVVHRKTRPYNMGRPAPWEFVGVPMHTLYLKLPKPLHEGSAYTLEFPGLSLPKHRFTMRSSRLVSEAVHVSQIGFRPDDPAKVAFVSCWMGDGGGLSYPPGMAFLVVDADKGSTAYKGTLALSKAASDATEDVYKRNYNGTDVYIADFSKVTRPGRYSVVVPGIGCSLPFRIDREVWTQPFRTSVRGLYHARSGIALGPPYTKFVRPRDFHPDDGVTVYASKTPILETGNGPLGYDIEPTNFGNLVKGKTDEVVPNAWGGYHDAGDWDRRVQHLVSTRHLLDLVDLFPSWASTIKLNIPESGNKLPDMLDEALFGLDVYRRLQTKEGGIRGGIESEEHPRYGDTSWRESLTAMAYAPDAWSSYWYAGTAARAARVLGKFDPKLADEYRKSALRAMAWAESQPKPTDRPASTDGGYSVDTRRFDVLRDSRNYAAAELFRLTGDGRWHDIFKATTFLDKPDAVTAQWASHDQNDAAWVYVRTKGADEKLRARVRAALLRVADERLAVGAGTGFRWTKYPWRPFGIGVPAVPDALNLVWAHYLTNDTKYLKGAVLAAQFGAGANPLNMTFTVGVGHRYPQHPLHLDSRLTGQPAPEGITVLGPMDVTNSYFPGDWGRKLLAPYCYPDLQKWPPVESYADILWNALMCEFTIHDAISPNFLTWGYLAARAPVAK